MRISDWSSDVFSSDLNTLPRDSSIGMPTTASPPPTPVATMTTATGIPSNSTANATAKLMTTIPMLTRLPLVQSERFARGAHRLIRFALPLRSVWVHSDGRAPKSDPATEAMSHVSQTRPPAAQNLQKTHTKFFEDKKGETPRKQ